MGKEMSDTELSFEAEFDALLTDEGAAPGDSEGLPEELPAAAEIAATQEQPEVAAQPTTEQERDWRAEAERAYHAARSQAGRITGMQQKLAEMEAQLQEARRAASKPEEVDSEWERVKEEYPDIAGPLDKKIEYAVQVAEERARQAAQEEADRKKAIDEITARNHELLYQDHPDAWEIAHSDDFQAWQQTLSPAALSLVQSANVSDVSMMLGLYKHFRGEKQRRIDAAGQKRALQLESARVAPGSRGEAKGNGPAEDSVDAWFEFYERNKP